MPIYALAGDIAACSGIAWHGTSITLAGGFIIAALAIAVDTVRARRRVGQGSDRSRHSSRFAPDVTPITEPGHAVS